MRRLATVLMATVLLGAALSHSVSVAQDEPPATEGIVITVTSVSDEVNGDVVDSRKDATSKSTVSRLIARPGPDGISLREAIEATNQDPGRYTIEFAPDLAGLTISALPLPHLISGGVTINGDIDGDEEPDVTIRAASPTVPGSGLHVSSSDNTLNALELIGWETGVSLQARATETDATYANTTLVNLVIREARIGILLNSPGDRELRDTQNRWIDTRIVANRIEATDGGISLGLHYTIGDVVDGLVIEGNEIRTRTRCPVDCPEAGVGIGLGAGFWDGSTGNQFTNVVIADNTITESASGVVLSTGAVGASGNLISGVRISNNTIELGGTGVLSTGIQLLAADASTTYNDPTYTPVAYPDDNVIRDIEILDNTIGWAGDIGIQVWGGGPGSHNTVESVRIAGNELIGTQAAAGIAIGTGAGSDLPDDYRPSVGNRVSGLRIEDNHIRITGIPEDLSGAIVLSAGMALTVEHQLNDAQVSGNDIESSLPGILLRGGGKDTTGNQITGVELICNRITGRPEILMIGGQGSDASGNLIEDVVLSGNLTGDVLNNVSSQPNMEGASGNNVDWTVVDQIPADCPISAPSAPASEAQAQPTPGPATQDSANLVTETGPDSLEPWVWAVGAAAVVGLVISWVLLAQRRKSLRRTP